MAKTPRQSKGSNDRPQHGVVDEIKLPEGTVTTVLGRDADKKHSVVYTSASGPLRSVYVMRDAFPDGMPDSITFHMVPSN